MTNQTPQYPHPSWPAPRRAGLWSRMTPVQRAGALAVAILLPCCGGLTVVGALADDPKAAPDPGRAVAEQVAATQQSPEPAPATEPVPDLTTTPVSEPAGTTAPAAATTTPAAPAVTTRTVTERKPIPFTTRRVDDDNLAEGETRVRTRGVPGVRTLTYQVTLTDGRETTRRLVRSTVTRRPVTKVVAVGTGTEPSGGDCHPGYRPCVPVSSDVDCAGGGGNGPAYVSGPVRVLGDDPYDLDRDGDGIACD